MGRGVQARQAVLSSPEFQGERPWFAGGKTPV